MFPVAVPGREVCPGPAKQFKSIKVRHVQVSPEIVSTRRLPFCFQGSGTRKRDLAMSNESRT